MISKTSEQLLNFISITSITIDQPGNSTTLHQLNIEQSMDSNKY